MMSWWSTYKKNDNDDDGDDKNCERTGCHNLWISTQALKNYFLLMRMSRLCMCICVCMCVFVFLCVYLCLCYDLLAKATWVRVENNRQGALASLSSRNIKTPRNHLYEGCQGRRYLQTTKKKNQGKQVCQIFTQPSTSISLVRFSIPLAFGSWGSSITPATQDICYSINPTQDDHAIPYWV